jgi:hypothetical protein
MLRFHHTFPKGILNTNTSRAYINYDSTAIDIWQKLKDKLSLMSREEIAQGKPESLRTHSRIFKSS